MEKKKQDIRVRNYATIVYPDSEHTPENWQEIISDQCIPTFISPLHDNDKNPNGEDKKPHYHVMFMFENKKSIPQVEELIGLFGGVGVEKVNSLRGYARYLCHLDNPEKAQYSQEDVRSMAGADYASVVGLATDKYKAIREMMDFCKVNEVDSYSDLLEYCAEERMDWFRVLCDSASWVMIEYLKSKSWTTKIRRQEKIKQKREEVE